MEYGYLKPGFWNNIFLYVHSMYLAYILQRLSNWIFYTNTVGSINIARPRLENFGCRIPHY